MLGIYNFECNITDSKCFSHATTGEQESIREVYEDLRGTSLSLHTGLAVDGAEPVYRGGRAALPGVQATLLIKLMLASRT